MNRNIPSSVLPSHKASVPVGGATAGNTVKTWAEGRTNDRRRRTRTSRQNDDPPPWCSRSHEVHIWINTLHPDVTAAPRLSKESNENANPAEVKSIKMSTTDHSQVTPDRYGQVITDRDPQSNPFKQTKQTKTSNQRKINAIHEATLVVKALLWLCLLSI